jgi:hypothetical protein
MPENEAQGNTALDGSSFDCSAAGGVLVKALMTSLTSGLTTFHSPVSSNISNAKSNKKFST